MTEHIGTVYGVGLGPALQAALDDGTPANDNGEGVTLAGYVAAVVYVRPDGTSGLTVLAPYDDADTVLALLDKAGELVSTHGPADDPEG